LTHLGLKQYVPGNPLLATQMNIWIVWHIIGASAAIEGLVPNVKDALSR